MHPDDLAIEADIRRAETLPGRAYGDPALHAAVIERIFARAWHFAGDTDAVRVPGPVHPTLLGEGSLDEPVLLARDARDEVRCLSNVCTHRGALLCAGPGVETVLRCRYHGRRFALDGRMLSMPEFEAAADFPRPAVRADVRQAAHLVLGVAREQHRLVERALAEQRRVDLAGHAHRVGADR